MKLIASLASAVLLVCAAAPAFAQQKPPNPGNPCGGKKAANPCNPCGGKKAAGIAEPPMNPCFAKRGTVFHATDPMGRNSVTFNSEAPLEDITGTTNELHGYLVFDPKKPTAGVRGQMVVPVAAITTGIPLRDEHMRSADWLDAASYPTIAFTVENSANVKEVKRTEAAQTYELTLVGTFALHGRSRQVRIPARVTFLRESEQTRMKLPGDLLAVRAAFDVRLEDYGITGGSMGQVVGSKLSDTIKAEVSLFASSKAPAAGNPGNPCNPCNPCGGKKATNPCNPCGPKKKP